MTAKLSSKIKLSIIGLSKVLRKDLVIFWVSLAQIYVQQLLPNTHFNYNQIVVWEALSLNHHPKLNHQEEWSLIKIKDQDHLHP